MLNVGAYSIPCLTPCCLYFNFPGRCNPYLWLNVHSSICLWLPHPYTHILNCLLNISQYLVILQALSILNIQNWIKLFITKHSLYFLSIYVTVISLLPIFFHPCIFFLLHTFWIYTLYLKCTAALAYSHFLTYIVMQRSFFKKWKNKGMTSRTEKGNTVGG